MNLSSYIIYQFCFFSFSSIFLHLLSSEKKPVHPPRINSHNHATTHRTAITAMPSPTNSSHPLLNNPNSPRQRPVQPPRCRTTPQQPRDSNWEFRAADPYNNHHNQTSNPSSSLPLSLSLTPANATSVTLWEFFFGESKDIILTQEHHIQLGASACPFQILNSPIQLNASISYKWSNLFRLEMEECWLELVFLIL
jgi:hypothetical protein